MSAIAGQQASRKMRIGIVGAGIGGLAVTIALKQRGLAPVVIERRTEEQLLGEGIFLTLAPNGLNALRGLGLADAALSAGVVTTGILLHNENGKELGLVDYSAHTARFQAPSVTIRRGALGGVLFNAARAAGVEIRFGTSVDGISQTGAAVHLQAGGVSEQFDLVIAADGLRSTIRRLVMPQLPKPVYNGLIGSGGIVDIPGIAPTGGRMLMTFGRRGFFGYIKHGTGPVYWFENTPAPENTARELDPVRYLETLRALHRGDPLDNSRILTAASTIDRVYPDYDIPSLPHWSAGRIVLMGDAAHAVTPHSGQGASMALEDALVLAACLDAETDSLAAFHRFEALRRERVEAAVAIGRMGGAQKKSQGWFALRLRDLMLPLLLPLGQKAQEQLFAFRADETPLTPPTQRKAA